MLDTQILKQIVLFESQGLPQIKTEIGSMDQGINRAASSAARMERSFGSLAAHTVKWAIAWGMVRQVTNLVGMVMGSMLKTTIELDYRTAQLRRNLQGSASDIAQVNAAFKGQARAYGEDLLKVIDVGIEWAKQGKTAKEVIELTNATLMLQTAAYMESGQAQQFLTATMAAFKMEASDLPQVIDAVDKVSKETAIDAQELAAALQRSSFIAQQSKMSFNELVAVVATVGSVTRRSGEHIGVAMRSIFLGIQTVKAQTELSKVGIDVFGKTGEMQPMLVTLAQLSSKWDTLSDSQQSNIVLTTAGKFRAEEFKATLENFPEILANLNRQLNSQGEALRDVANNMDTLKKRVDALKASWQGLFSGEGAIAQQTRTTLGAWQRAMDIIAKWGAPKPVVSPLSAGYTEQAGKFKSITEENSRLRDRAILLKANVVLVGKLQKEYEEAVKAEGEESDAAIAAAQKRDEWLASVGMSYDELGKRAVEAAAASKKAEEEAEKAKEAAILSNKEEIQGIKDKIAEKKKELDQARSAQLAAYQRPEYKTKFLPTRLATMRGVESVEEENVRAIIAAIDDYDSKLKEVEDTLKGLLGIDKDKEDQDKQKKVATEELTKLYDDYKKGLEAVEIQAAQGFKINVKNDQAEVAKTFLEKLKKWIADNAILGTTEIQTIFTTTTVSGTDADAKSLEDARKEAEEKAKNAKRRGGGRAKKELFDAEWIKKQREALKNELDAISATLFLKGYDETEIKRELEKRIASYGETIIKASRTMESKLKLEEKKALVETAFGDKDEKDERLKGLKMEDVLKREYQNEFADFIKDLNKDIAKQKKDNNDEMLRNEAEFVDAKKRLYMDEDEYLRDKQRNLLEREKKLQAERIEIIKRLKSYGIDIKEGDSPEKVAKAYEDYNAKIISVVAELQSDITNIAVEAEGLTEIDIQFQDEQSRIMDKVYKKQEDKLALDDIELENDQKGITNKNQLLAISEKHLKIRKQIADDSEKEIEQLLSGFNKSDLKIETIPQTPETIADIMPNRLTPPPVQKGILVEGGKSELEIEMEGASAAIADFTKNTEDLVNVDKERKDNTIQEINLFKEAKQKEIEAIQQAIEAYKQAKDEFRSAVFEQIKNYMLDLTQTQKDMSLNISKNLAGMSLTKGFKSIGALEDKYLGGSITGGLGMSFMDPTQAAIMQGMTEGGNYARTQIYDAFVQGAMKIQEALGKQKMGEKLDIPSGASKTGVFGKIGGFMKSPYGKPTMDFANVGLMMGLGSAGGKTGLAQSMMGAMPMMGQGIGDMIAASAETAASAASDATGMIKMAGPIGAAIGTVAPLLLRMFGDQLFGGKEKKREVKTDRSIDNMSSKIDSTNRELSFVNRNLIAIKQTLDPYARPDSFYFRSRVGMGVQNQQLTIKMVDGGGNSRGSAIIDIVARDFSVQSVRGMQ